jgi:hypothetical protein
VFLASSTFLERSTIIGFFPMCPTVVGILDSYLFFFFLFFLFFFILSTELLSSNISLDEEDEMEEEVTSGEGEEYLTSENGEGST